MLGFYAQVLALLLVQAYATCRDDKTCESDSRPSASLLQVKAGKMNADFLASEGPNNDTVSDYVELRDLSNETVHKLQLEQFEKMHAKKEEEAAKKGTGKAKPSPKSLADQSADGAIDEASEQEEGEATEHDERDDEQMSNSSSLSDVGLHARKYYYAISHRTLTKREVDRAISDGANGIEIDVVAWWNECNQWDWKSAGCWWAQHDGLCNVKGGDLDCFGGRSAAGDRLSDMLGHIAWKIDRGAKVALVFIDIKNPDWCDVYSYKQCSVKMVMDLARSKLGSRVNIIYDTYGQFGYGYRKLNHWLQTGREALNYEIGASGLPRYRRGKTVVTHGHSIFSTKYCRPLQDKLNAGAKVATFWTSSQTWQILPTCGNAIIYGYIPYSYGTQSWKYMVDYAKRRARWEGLTWATRRDWWR